MIRIDKKHDYDLSIYYDEDEIEDYVTIVNSSKSIDWIDSVKMVIFDLAKFGGVSPIRLLEDMKRDFKAYEGMFITSTNAGVTFLKNDLNNFKVIYDTYLDCANNCDTDGSVTAEGYTYPSESVETFARMYDDYVKNDHHMINRFRNFCKEYWNLEFLTTAQKFAFMFAFSRSIENFEIVNYEDEE